MLTTTRSTSGFEFARPFDVYYGTERLEAPASRVQSPENFAGNWTLNAVASSLAVMQSGLLELESVLGNGNTLRRPAAARSYGRRFANRRKRECLR